MCFVVASVCTHMKLDVNFLCQLELDYRIRRTLVVLIAGLLQFMLMFASDLTHLNPTSSRNSLSLVL